MQGMQANHSSQQPSHSTENTTRSPYERSLCPFCSILLLREVSRYKDRQIEQYSYRYEDVSNRFLFPLYYFVVYFIIFSLHSSRPECVETAVENNPNFYPSFENRTIYLPPSSSSPFSKEQLKRLSPLVNTGRINRTDKGEESDIFSESEAMKYVSGQL